MNCIGDIEMRTPINYIGKTVAVLVYGCPGIAPEFVGVPN